MLSSIDLRKQAYQFVYEKIKELETQFSYNIEKYSEGTDIVYLADLDKLKRGVADPSGELVAILQKLLNRVASEGEIEENLVKPFQAESHSPE